MRVSFAEFAVDLESRELVREGERVHLSAKAFQLLELLLRSRPRALSKAELMETLWPGVYVLESNLAGLVAEIRKALGTSSRDGVIRTVQTYGYAFNAEVQEERQPILCHLMWREGQAALRAGIVDVGRDPSLPVLIDATTVSWSHARLQIGGTDRAPTVSVEDLGSRNGTFVNGGRVERATVLADGDELRLGSVVVRVRLAGGTHQRTDPCE
jgi:DNA-binding winged helix-turn-helix (wHTH) protein